MKIMKKILCTVLVVVMCLTSAPLSGFDFTTEAATEYKVGDIIEFGSYPQSGVWDSATKNALNALAPEWDDWTSYGYYSGTGDYGTMVRGDWMRYTDVTYNGNKYRGVKFTQYRPYYTHYQSSSSNTYQDNYGYSTNTVYWFKFEPIDWRVLDPNVGLVMCRTIIDSQPYSNTLYYNSGESDYTYTYFNDSSYTNYASDYETSSIRKWLNNDFYNTAFTDSEKKKINTTTLSNNGYYTTTWQKGYEDLDSNSTNDKVFLLSYDEVRNSKFGFIPEPHEDRGRQAWGGYYAKVQGLVGSSDENGHSAWLLRTPGYDSRGCCCVDEDGRLGGRSEVNDICSGIRPALRVNLDGFNEEPDCTHKETFEQTIPASCTVSGMKFTVCVDCGETIGNPEVIPAAHTPGEWETVVAPTYEAEGKKVKKCTVCGETLEEEIIPKLELAVVEDEETGVGLEFPAENYDGKVEIEVKESFDGTAFNILDTKTGAEHKKIYDIKMLVDGEVTQPNGKVKVKLPLPAGYNPKFSFVYYVNTETSDVEKMNATYEDGYMVFETDHFSYYAIIAEPDTDNCSCNCHKGGIKGFFFKFLLFFQKIFRTNKVCKCGINHY